MAVNQSQPESTGVRYAMYILPLTLMAMEITIKVDDREGPFLIELLRKFTFVREVSQNQTSLVTDRIHAPWQQKGQKLFAT